MQSVQPIWTDVFDGDRKGRNMIESHSHNHFELSLVICGEITVLFDEKKYVFDGNAVIVSPPFTNHHILVKSGRYYRRNIYFYSSAFEELPGYAQKLGEVFESGGSAIALSQKNVIRLEKIIELLESEEIDDNKSVLLSVVINTILNEVGDFKSHTKQKESYIDAVVRTILNEYQTRLVAEELATRFFVSRTKLMTDFKSKIGKTLLEYITFVRLEHAKELLCSGESILETAMICGFGNSANFARVFKKHINMTPKEYQMKRR